MAKRKIIEVGENGEPYEKVCIHGVHFAGCDCIVCHPEKMASVAWLFSPEMDAAYAAATCNTTKDHEAHE